MSKRILVLDDEAGINQITKSVLSLKGYEVVAFNQPSEALASIADSSYDLILADVMMPEMNGDEFLRKVRASGNTDTKAVFLTAKKLNEEERAAMHDMGADILFKPFKPQSLLELVGRLLG